MPGRLWGSNQSKRGPRRILDAVGQPARAPVPDATSGTPVFPSVPHPSCAIDRLLPPPLGRLGDVVMIHIYRIGDVQRSTDNRTNVLVEAGCRAETLLEGGGRIFAMASPRYDAGLAHSQRFRPPKKLAE